MVLNLPYLQSFMTATAAISQMVGILHKLSIPPSSSTLFQFTDNDTLGNSDPTA